MPITVLIADDKEAVLRTIRVLLRRDPEIRIIGEAGNYQQTSQSMLNLKPQVVVMDLHNAWRIVYESAGNQVRVRHIRVGADYNVFLERRGHAGAC